MELPDRVSDTILRPDQYTDAAGYPGGPQGGPPQVLLAPALTMRALKSWLPYWPHHAL